MTKFIEKDLEVTFNGVIRAINFDDSSHGLSRCMKAIDFMVELPDKYLFIEFKDPEHPRAQSASATKWKNEFTSGQLDDDFVKKFRDSLVYEWASGRADKPIVYYLLIAMSGPDATLLGPKAQDLRRKLPTGPQPKTRLIKPIALDCLVFNISTWNRSFPNYPIRRISSNPGP